jgi:preprotein translocase subunit YajC
MNPNNLAVILGQPPPAGATAPVWMQLFPILLIVVAMYFALLRPQQKRAKELNTLLKSLKPGDKVVTGSGIVGTVVSVKDRTIALRSAETKLEVLKSAVSEITERSGAESADS